MFAQCWSLIGVNSAEGKLEINKTIMTDNNNKFVPQAQTYEVKYIEVKEPSKISQIASYLGFSWIECSSDNSNSCKEVSKATSSSSSGTFTNNEKVESVKTLDKASNDIGNRANLEDERKKGNEQTGGYHSETIKYKPRAESK